jgi:Tol biopolymer transport system component
MYLSLWKRFNRRRASTVLGLLALIAMALGSATDAYARGARVVLAGYTNSPDAFLIVSVRPDGSRPHTLARSTGFSALYTSPVWSPDHRWIAFVRIEGQNADVWVMRGDGSEKRRLTRGPAWDVNPVWSPQGDQIAWQRAVYPNHTHVKVMVMRPDGSGKRVLTGESASASEYEWGVSWSPDGQRIAFTSYAATEGTTNENLDIYVVNVAGGPLKQVTHTRDYELYPTWSPTSNTIAFVQPYPSQRAGVVHPWGGLRYITARTATNTSELEWRPDGRRLAVNEGIRIGGDFAGEIVVVNPWRPSQRRVVTPATFDAGDPAWSPTGQRLAFIGIDYRATRPGNNGYTVSMDDGEPVRLNRFGTRDIDW